MAEPVTLATLGHGAAEELFNEELQRVLQNIMDPNTKATAPREITLKVKLTPTEQRELAGVGIQATSKLAPIKPFGTQFYIGQDPKTKSCVAAESDPKQMEMFKADPNKVVELGGGK